MPADAAPPPTAISTRKGARTCAGRSGCGLSAKTRRLLWRASLILTVCAVAAGCTNPSASTNAFVVHIVASGCELDSELEPLLVMEKTAGNPTTEWRSLRRVGECGEPFAGHTWSGDVVQVWVSGYHWHRSRAVRVQMGHRVNDADTWAIGDDDRMRIDHTHIFLGTIDIGVPNGAYVPADAIAAVATQLQDRQDCEAVVTGCGAEWRHADLLTFKPAPPPPSDSPQTPAKTTDTLAP